MYAKIGLRGIQRLREPANVSRESRGRLLVFSSFQEVNMRLATVLVVFGLSSLFVGCGGAKKPPVEPAVPVESTLTDPTCRDSTIRLCLHRFPAPDVDRKNYDKCLREEYAECLAP